MITGGLAGVFNILLFDHRARLSASLGRALAVRAKVVR